MAKSQSESISSGGHLGHGHTGMTLRDLTLTQQKFGSTHFTGAVDAVGKRRQVVLHLGILGGKLFRIEERLDHGVPDDGGYDILIDEVISDLLVFAAQLATLEGVDLEDVYRRRLNGDSMRSQVGDTISDLAHSGGRLSEDVYVAEFEEPPSDQSITKLTKAVLEVIADDTLTDQEVRDALGAEILSHGVDSAYSQLLGNFAVSVRKLRCYADRFVSMVDVEREVHDLIRRERAQLTGRGPYSNAG